MKLAVPINPALGVKMTSILFVVPGFNVYTAVPPVTGSTIAQPRVSPSASEPLRVIVIGVPSVVFRVWE